jgi:hypothetical protein
MMTVYAILDGGASYSFETTATPFERLSDVIAEYNDRGSNSYFPCWGDERCGERDERGRRYVGMAWRAIPNGAFADTYGPLDTHDCYPDLLLVEGPRGGLYWEGA